MLPYFWPIVTIVKMSRRWCKNPGSGAQNQRSQDDALPHLPRIPQLPLHRYCVSPHVSVSLISLFLSADMRAQFCCKGLCLWQSCLPGHHILLPPPGFSILSPRPRCFWRWAVCWQRGTRGRSCQQMAFIAFGSPAFCRCSCRCSTLATATSTSADGRSQACAAGGDRCAMSWRTCSLPSRSSPCSPWQFAVG